MEKGITMFKVKIDFPWSIHKVGDVIRTYEGVCMAYVVEDADGHTSGKCDLRDFPEIYEEIIS